MIPEFICRVNGIPKPQGSTIARIVKGKGGKPDFASARPDNKALRPWRDSMSYEFHQIDLARVGCEEGPWFPKGVPVLAIAVFVFPRLKNMPRSGDLFHTVAPDTDKLQRAVGDSLQESLIVANDSQISPWDARKRYARVGELPGLYLILKAMEAKVGK